MFDSILEVPEGSEPIALEELLTIGEVSQADVKQAAKRWKNANAGEFENLLDAEPD